jgi:type 1 glutamine amidotransferase
MLRLLALILLLSAALTAATKIVLIAGKPSHPPGEHEFNAGIMLLDKWLHQNQIDSVVVKGGWPEDESVFDGAAALVFYMDGGKGHPIIQGDHLAKIGALMKKGVGLACLHYAVEVPADNGGPEFLDWIGGYYETAYSTNPINQSTMEQASPDHPISKGWKTFDARDEWYYRIRFKPEDPRLTPILTTMLPKTAPNREICSWAVERADGGRGFGFTGAHFHSNWGNPDFRRLVLNGILWTAKVRIPADGAQSTVTEEELKQNLDPKPPKKST